MSYLKQVGFIPSIERSWWQGVEPILLNPGKLASIYIPSFNLLVWNVEYRLFSVYLILFVHIYHINTLLDGMERSWVKHSDRPNVFSNILYGSILACESRKPRVFQWSSVFHPKVWIFLSEYTGWVQPSSWQTYLYFTCFIHSTYYIAVSNYCGR